MLQAVTTPPLWTSCRTRLRQTGVGEAEAERGVATVAKALADEGPLTRAQLRERLDSADVPTAGQAFIHVLFYAALHGVCVRGPMVGKEHAFVSARDWLGEPPEVDREAALAEVARRYLVGHGPATRRRPRPLGRPAAARRARRAHRDLPPARRPRRRPRRPPQTRGARAAPAAAPARRLRPAAARLGLARRRHRPPSGPGHDQRHLPPLRPRRRPRGRHLASAQGQGRDRAPRAGHEKGGRPARSRRDRRRSVPRELGDPVGPPNYVSSFGPPGTRTRRASQASASFGGIGSSFGVGGTACPGAGDSSCSQTWFSETCR